VQDDGLPDVCAKVMQFSFFSTSIQGRCFCYAVCVILVLVAAVGRRMVYMQLQIAWNCAVWLVG
jgi:polyferredoxin